MLPAEQDDEWQAGQYHFRPESMDLTDAVAEPNEA